ncbi:hypothetical protein E2C01_077983 [Portunus trituberculatus]|uniref:Uncharacterized protein n=1 Tax=Portunus trituberculatus TaxID=210409 RepID=A0A5B7INP1_PORTR|nr:hypothetical protein [Portunus trituberculatus]
MDKSDQDRKNFSSQNTAAFCKWKLFDVYMNNKKHE